MENVGGVMVQKQTSMSERKADLLNIVFLVVLAAVIIALAIKMFK